jgi:hypothetical protein
MSGTIVRNSNEANLGASAADLKRCSWKRALILTGVLRLVYSVVAAVAALVQPVNWRLLHSNALTENLLPPNHGMRYLWLGVWERFDTLWYLHIATYGYDRPESVVFFPLYPSLIKMLSVVMPPIAAALLISTVAAFCFFWGLEKLLSGDYAPNVVDESVLLCAVWPASFIFFAGYTESLLLALIVWSVCLAREDRWTAAAALGLAAALTKAIGVVVFVPLLIMAYRSRRSVAWPVILVPLGTAAYLGYLRLAGHSALGAAYAQYWRTSAAAPWTTLWPCVSTLAHAPNLILILNLTCLAVVCILTAKSRARVEYLVYAAAAIGLVLCKQTTPPLQSMMRYVLIIFPAWAGLARLLQTPHWRSRFRLVCACLFLMNLGLLWLFEGWSLVV